MTHTVKTQASLETLVESLDLGVEILHPGGIAVTHELATLCEIGLETQVLDVASGTGESACYLAEQFGCQVVGVDHAPAMVTRARRKATDRRLAITFQQADALHLPFQTNSFDVALSECTLCLLDKDQALREMLRVVKPGGYVGIHDLCWRDEAPPQLKRRLAELEGERPETQDGWIALFERMGLVEVKTVDKSALLPVWMKETRKQIGLLGQVKIFLSVLGRWGIQGYRRVRESEKIFDRDYLGYSITVGKNRK